MVSARGYNKVLTPCDGARVIIFLILFTTLINQKFNILYIMWVQSELGFYLPRYGRTNNAHTCLNSRVRT